MKRLTGTDAMFLAMETPDWHQHVGGLTILDPGDREVTFDDVVQMMDQRIASAPKFRWKLQGMPLGLDRPVWVDDENFDVRRHTRRIAVPAPGGLRETAEVAGMLLSSQLDRRRPLWEMWFLEGLTNGRVAIVMKYHHCLLDGMAGASLSTVMMDVEPDAPRSLMSPPSPEEQSAGPRPTQLEMWGQLASEVATRPLRYMRYVVGGIGKLAAGANVVARDERVRDSLGAPSTPFNRPIGPRRALSFASVALEDLKALRVHHDVKINDLIIALVAGALRDYLLELDSLPEAALVTAMPISTRAAGDTRLNNQISNVFTSMATDVADPVERLHAIAESTKSAKLLQQALSAHQIQSLGEVASPLLLSTAIRALYRSHLAALPGVFNTIVSNVPGPPVPVYVCGARVTGIFPSSIIMAANGINATVFSYMDRVDFGFHVDPDLVPDPWAVADRIVPALAELMEASGLGPVTAIADAFGELGELSETGT